MLLAGLLVAAVLLLASRRDAGPTKYQPFDAGQAAALHSELKDGGPFYVPDPFGGNRNIVFALESGNVVALSAVLPGTKACAVKWKGSVNAFVDCHGDKLRSTELDRYVTEIGEAGASKGELLIDLRHKVPSPDGIYAIRDRWGALQFKRLETSKILGDQTIRVISDNGGHVQVAQTEDDLNIVGRVVGGWKFF